MISSRLLSCQVTVRQIYTHLAFIMTVFPKTVNSLPPILRKVSHRLSDKTGTTFCAFVQRPTFFGPTPRLDAKGRPFFTVIPLLGSKIRAFRLLRRLPGA